MGSLLHQHKLKENTVLHIENITTVKYLYTCFNLCVQEVYENYVDETDLENLSCNYCSIKGHIRLAKLTTKTRIEREIE